MGSKWPFGSILNQFWQGLGKIWMSLGSSGTLTIESFASHGHFLNTLGVPCCLTLCYRNPRVASLRFAERHNTRGFRPLTRVKPTLTSGFSVNELTWMGFRKVTLGLRSLRSREWGFAIPSGTGPFWFWSLKLAQVGTIFAFFRICSAFFGFPHSSWLFPSICFHFFLFFFDFSSIWDRFREGFSMIFDTFFETCQNVWKSTKHCVGA